MQLARYIAAFVVLQRHDPAQQASIILAEATERTRESLASSELLRISGGPVAGIRCS